MSCSNSSDSENQVTRERTPPGSSKGYHTPYDSQILLYNLELQELRCREGACPVSVGRVLELTRESGASVCSASLIGADLVLTARHCLKASDDDLKRKDYCPSAVGFRLFAHPQFPAQSVLCREVVYASPQVDPALASINEDLVVLRLQKHVDRPYYPVSRLGLADNEQLTSLTAAKVERRLECVARHNSVLFPVGHNALSVSLMVSGCQFEPGESGSPILNARGEVVGVAHGQLKMRKAPPYWRAPRSRQQFSVVSSLACLNISDWGWSPQALRCRYDSEAYQEYSAQTSQQPFDQARLWFEQVQNSSLAEFNSELVFRYYWQKVETETELEIHATPYPHCWNSAHASVSASHVRLKSFQFVFYYDEFLRPRFNVKNENDWQMQYQWGNIGAENPWIKIQNFNEQAMPNLQPNLLVPVCDLKNASPS